MEIRLNYFKYNPVYSFMNFLLLKLSKRLVFPVQNIGKESVLANSKKYSVFLEMDILGRDKLPRKGTAVFRIIFYTPDIPVEKIIRRTALTIPFFCGLPGFCTKQFMVNKEEKSFSGRYEWETLELARNYARSYAVAFMKRRSCPMPVTIEITDKKSGEIVEKLMINTAK